MRKLIARALFACGCLVLAACGPVSQVPLIDSDEARQDERLYGTWVGNDPPSTERTFLHIGEHAGREMSPDDKPGLMQAWLIATGERQMADKEGRSWKYIASGPPLGLSWTSYPLGDDWVASLSTGADVPVSMQKVLEDLPQSGLFWFLKYRVDGDQLKVWTVNSDFVAQAIQKGELQGTARRVGTFPFRMWEIGITDSQENLRAFFEHNKHRGLFSSEPLQVYKKLGSR